MISEIVQEPDFAGVQVTLPTRAWNSEAGNLSRRCAEVDTNVTESICLPKQETSVDLNI